MRTDPRLLTALLILGTVLATPAGALTSVQIGPSGKSYASAALQCGLHPVAGLAPFVNAGLYNPKKSTSGTVSLGGSPIATVTLLSPDATVWLAASGNTVVVTLDRRTADSYAFDATPAANQPNVCIPDTSGNTVSGGLEYAASGKSYATVAAGCAFNAATGRAQPYVHLFDSGTYLLNVSINNVPLTQLGPTRRSTPVFLAAGLNVIAAANASLSTDHFVRDGDTGSCTLP